MAGSLRTYVFPDKTANALILEANKGDVLECQFLKHNSLATNDLRID